MFKLDPHASYVMPAHFGPRKYHPKATGWYRDVTTMVVPFVTERDALAAYLPEPFEVGEVPIVTVTYACNREVDWLAGHGYNLVSVNAAAVYDGAKERMAGNYCLVMWENLADPILTGRELQGIPKVYADIADHTVIDGEWRTQVGHFGHKFLDIQVSDLRPPTVEEIEADGKAREGKDHPMAWRYLPGISGFGTAISEPTTYPSETVVREAMVGTGLIEWQELTWEQNPTQYHIVNAIAALPVVTYLSAITIKGSVNLIVPENMPRALK